MNETDLAPLLGNLLTLLMARTKQTARKSTVHVTPPVPEDADAAVVVVGTKRPLDDPEPDPPAKRVALGMDKPLRNKIHWRMHSVVTFIVEAYPSMRDNTELLDRAMERAKNTFIDEFETMLIDPSEQRTEPL